MADETRRYRFVGSHADALASGRPVEPGEFVELTEEEVNDPYNQTLIKDENLFEVEAVQQPKATDAATKLAKSNDIPLTAITATGADGSITQGDVETYIATNQEEEAR